MRRGKSKKDHLNWLTWKILFDLLPRTNDIPSHKHSLSIFPTKIALFPQYSSSSRINANPFCGLSSSTSLTFEHVRRHNDMSFARGSISHIFSREHGSFSFEHDISFYQEISQKGTKRSVSEDCIASRWLSFEWNTSQFTCAATRRKQSLVERGFECLVFKGDLSIKKIRNFEENCYTNKTGKENGHILDQINILTNNQKSFILNQY